MSVAYRVPNVYSVTSPPTLALRRYQSESLAAIDQGLEPYDPDEVHGYRLTLNACRRMLSVLAALPLERRRQVPGLLPARAPTIVAGAVILVESMSAFELDSIETSEADLLHGAALDALLGLGRRGDGG